MCTSIVKGLLLSLFITGCGISYQQGPRPPGSYLVSHYERDIQHSQTTEQEIRQWFGDPWTISKDLQGRPRYIYFFDGYRYRLDVVFQNGLVYAHDLWGETSRMNNR